MKIARPFKLWFDLKLDDYYWKHMDGAGKLHIVSAKTSV
jgi:hypothetical protein